MRKRYRLLTQTQPKNRQEAQWLQQQGIDCLCLPLLQIVACRPMLDDRMLSACSIAIVASQHAVRLGHRFFSICDQANFFAIGASTQKALLACGIDALCPTKPFNSERLLSMPALHALHGQSIILFCGKNPRPLLSAVLRQRGAVVHEYAVYFRRRTPQAYCLAFLQQKRHQLDQVALHSLDALRYWLVLSQQLIWLLDIRVTVNSLRLQKIAQRCGLSDCHFVDHTAMSC